MKLFCRGCEYDSNNMAVLDIFVNVLAVILLFCAIVFMLYCCGYLVNDCMKHPIKIGSIHINADPENRHEPENITENALYDGEKV